MAGARDPALLDALEAIDPVVFDDTLWRVVRDGRDPLQCGSSGGRWDDGTFDVLYTSLSDAGAVAEMRFHLSRGQPVMPSKVRYGLHELHARVERALELVDLAALRALGMNTDRYGALSYAEREQEYPSSQQVAEAALFMGFDGLIVPNARHASLNAVLFCDRVPAGDMAVVRNHGPIDWREWADRIRL